MFRLPTHDAEVLHLTFLLGLKNAHIAIHQHPTYTADEKYYLSYEAVEEVVENVEDLGGITWKKFRAEYEEAVEMWISKWCSGEAVHEGPPGMWGATWVEMEMLLEDE
jgi:hypothetical protein